MSYLIPLEVFRRFAIEGEPKERRATGYRVGDKVRLVRPETGMTLVVLREVDLYIDIAEAGEDAMIVGPGVAFDNEQGARVYVPADWVAREVGMGRVSGDVGSRPWRKA